MNININIDYKFSKPKKRKNTDCQPSASFDYSSQYSNDTKCFVGGRHYSESISQNVYEKLNAKTKKLVKITKARCSVCGRKRSQILTK